MIIPFSLKKYEFFFRSLSSFTEETLMTRRLHFALKIVFVKPSETTIQQTWSVFLKRFSPRITIKKAYSRGTPINLCRYACFLTE